eukprot:CAMPEP_0119036962 /NCGR_PEP_ID=MMETSP1177-20130426/5011_1 /TAXON_ID=2985 /ORGANISM="Ochromonas sp, Strain CCMP1899" /LENGTH=356 /DNA_ID=CAMNT_0006997549 /DNA_START=148 /DNA_END=1215 /DNA_ORIENTATION=-
MDTLHDSFNKCNQLFLNAEGNSEDDSCIMQTVIDIESLIQRVLKADLFSKGEDLEEYTTNSLKFLYLQYFLGKVHTHFNNLLERKRHLISAEKCLKNYLKQCFSIGILDDEDLNDDDENPKTKGKTPEDVRDRKIAKYRREKEAKERMQLLQRLLEKKTSEEDLDNEDETRGLMVLQLQCYARDAIDELDVIKQEKVLLDHMDNLRNEQEELQALRHNDNGSSSSDRRVNDRGTGSSSSGWNGSRVGSVEGLPNRENEIDHGGICVTTSSKVGDQVLFSRETIVSSVFRPSISAPTMTLEEYGDIQKAEAEARSRNEGQQEGNVIKRYDQLAVDGGEDDYDLVDKATDQDREWDAW